MYQKSRDQYWVSFKTVIPVRCQLQTWWQIFLKRAYHNSLIIFASTDSQFYITCTMSTFSTFYSISSELLEKLDSQRAVTRDVQKAHNTAGLLRKTFY